MAKDVVILDYHGADAPGVPKVDVRSVISGVSQQDPYPLMGTVSQWMSWALRGSTHPQIPVLLIPTVTSPCLRLSPFFTSFRLGPLSLTHKLCAGSVKTPTLGFVIADNGSAWVAMVAVLLALGRTTDGGVTRGRVNEDVLGVVDFGVEEKEMVPWS